MAIPKTRIEAIIELLEKEHVSDQQKLVQLLKEKYGIVTNQAVISRDLHKLGVIKKKIQGAIVYEIPTTDVTSQILQLAITAVEHNETTIVIKTHPGLAAFVGDYLDQQVDLPILGCIAGENVIFVVPKTIHQIQSIYNEVCQKLKFKISNSCHL